MGKGQRSIYLDYGNNSLAFISVRATGFDPSVDRIVEIAVFKKRKAGPPLSYHEFVYPGVPILPQATEFHGVGDSNMRFAKPFEEIAPGLSKFLGKANLAGFGIRRQALPLLEAEYRRIYQPFYSPRVTIDLEDVYLHHHPRHLGAAVAHYLGHELSAHCSGVAEASALAKILDAQLTAHQDMPDSVSDLKLYPFARTPMGLFSFESSLRPRVFAEGRHRGRTPDEVAQVDPDYLRSMLCPERRWLEDNIIEAALERVAAAEAKPETPVQAL